jgi:hypothetical protein
MLLARVDDLPAREVAARFDTDQATVQPWLDGACAVLRARLSARRGAGEDAGAASAGGFAARGRTHARHPETETGHDPPDAKCGRQPRGASPHCLRKIPRLSTIPCPQRRNEMNASHPVVE